nr:MAG TPA: hypothetical protein [Caudoviricetes sp.]
MIKIMIPALRCFGRLLIFSHSNKLDKFVILLIVCYSKV